MNSELARNKIIEFKLLEPREFQNKFWPLTLQFKQRKMQMELKNTGNTYNERRQTHITTIRIFS
jgi:hypothetical protein